MAKLKDEMLAAVAAVARAAYVSALRRYRPDHPALKLADLVRLAEESGAHTDTNELFARARKTFLSILVGTATCAVITTLDKLSQRHLLASMSPADIADLLERIPLAVVNDGDIDLEDADEPALH